jgi:hypothetical protein
MAARVAVVARIGVAAVARVGVAAVAAVARVGVAAKAGAKAGAMAENPRTRVQMMAKHLPGRKITRRPGDRWVHTRMMGAGKGPI